MQYQMTKRDIAMYQRRNKQLKVPMSPQVEIFLDKFQASERKLSEVQKILCKPDCSVNRIFIHQNQFNDKKIDLLTDALNKNQSINTIIFKRCHLRHTQLEKICVCISKKNYIQELQINQMRINKQGAVAIAKILKNTKLRSLHLTDTGLDCDTIIELCQGLKKSNSIEYLDLRHNIFDSKGLKTLIDSLQNHMSIKHLYLESMRIDLPQAKSLANFFQKKQCKMEELELNQADIEVESLDVIMAALYETDNLRRLSLSKNFLTNTICQHLSDMPRKLHQFESLCLSHCEISEDGLESLCKGFYGQTTIQYLDLSWNNINSNDMKFILKMLENNKSLQKLLIQHNYLGAHGAQQMVEALKLHPEIKYLDISANDIESDGFLYFKELFKGNHSLQNLHVRKNNINGEEVISFPPSLHDNTNLFYLDLKDNNIDDECAQKLITLLNTNYFIEDLVIQGNNYINQATKETIFEECRKNLLIKEYILNNLVRKDGTIMKEVEDFNDNEPHFKNYSVDCLTIENKSFFRSDFIAKFINMNIKDFIKLRLINVHFDEHIRDLALFLKNVKTRIQVIVLNDCAIGDTSISRLIADCRVIQTLRELRLIKMNLNVHTEEILQAVQDHRNLKILDLSHNNIQEMNVIASLLVKNETLQELVMTGNPIENQEQMEHLIMGMMQNISITKLHYDVKGHDCLEVSKVGSGQATFDSGAKEQEIKKKFSLSSNIDPREVELLEEQIQVNKYIAGTIVPLQVTRRLKGTNLVDLSCLPIGEHIEAVVKYFRVQHESYKKRRLLLRQCGLDNQQAIDILALLFNTSGSVEMDEIDLSQNNLTDGLSETLATLLSANYKLKKINLSETQISNDGFRTIMRSIRKNTHIEVLDFSYCHLDYRSTTGWQGILDDISTNCSLIQLELVGNVLRQEFVNLYTQEISQNKCIRDLIIPSIQEKQARKGKTTNVGPKLMEFSSTGTVNQGNYNRRRTQLRTQELLSKGSLLREKESKLGKQVLEAIKEGKGRQENSSDSEDESSSDDSDQGQGVLVGEAGAKIQTLSLRGKNLTSLDFLSKFMRENPNIVDIDVGENPLTDREMQKFRDNIKSNFSVRKLGMDGLKNLKSGTKTTILRELEKNDKIQDVIKKNLVNADASKTILTLKKQSIQNVGFIQKFLQGYQELKVLDLTDNRLGNRGAAEITQLIEETTTIETLNLRNNRIGPSGLQHICSALSVNKSIKNLDIRDNMVQDESLKILLAMLYRNHTIQQIRYSITNEENIERKKFFNSISHLTTAEIEQKLKQRGHHDELKCWQKACLPVWCWKSFIHDKHEAFRFKYDTKALNVIEDELMGGLTVLLYLSSVVYYVIMFAAPVAFVGECGAGISNTSHFIYAGHSILTFFLELFVFMRIQRRINNKNLLSFNKWHFVELFMGQVARFDTYLDVCFLSLVWQCQQWELVIPIASLIFLFCTYPLYTTFVKLRRVDTSFRHTLPKIERNCNLAFIRENMLLATVLDSFCIDNNTEICKKPIPFGRFCGAWTLTWQDGPQMFIHLIFMFLHPQKHISHAELTVVMSLVCSAIAIQISIFNIIMCKPNEFDPLLLQLELKRRNEVRSRKQQRLQQQKDWFKKKIANMGKSTINKVDLMNLKKNVMESRRSSGRPSIQISNKKSGSGNMEVDRVSAGHEHASPLVCSGEIAKRIEPSSAKLKEKSIARRKEVPFDLEMVKKSIERSEDSVIAYQQSDNNIQKLDQPSDINISMPKTINIDVHSSPKQSSPGNNTMKTANMSLPEASHVQYIMKDDNNSLMFQKQFTISAQILNKGKERKVYVKNDESQIQIKERESIPDSYDMDEVDMLSEGSNDSEIMSINSGRAQRGGRLAVSPKRKDYFSNKKSFPN